MPYLATQPIIVSAKDEFGRRYGYHEFLPNNGSRLRHTNGVLIANKYNPKKENFILYASRTPEGSVAGKIQDEQIVRRVRQYLAEYYRQRYTNCSAFAHFLFTGEFIECEDKHNLAVVQHHMQHYGKVHKVNVGDMLCVIHVKKRFAQSRKTPWRKHYLKVRKSRKDKGADLKRSLHNEERVLTPNQILEFCKSSSMVDYHFMVCVDFKSGKPVWLSQLGRDDGKGSPSPFAITYGNEDCRPNEVPILTLIKRRK